jgi:hypothetical protein
MDATTFKAWWLRRISRRERVTFFLGTAMILSHKRKGSHGCHGIAGY